MLLSRAVFSVHRGDSSCPLLAARPCLFGSSLNSPRTQHLSIQCPVCLTWAKVTWVLYTMKTFTNTVLQNPSLTRNPWLKWGLEEMVWRAFSEGIWTYSKPLGGNSCYKGNLFPKIEFTNFFSYLLSNPLHHNPHISWFRALCNLMLAMLKVNTIWHLVIMWVMFPRW